MQTDTSPASVPLRTAPRAPSTLLLGALLVTLVARQVFAFWERYDGSTDAGEIRAFGDAYWPMNLLVLGPAFAVGFALQAILAWQLGRGRGRIVTGVGAALLLVGGALFALLATAHALPFDWAANHGILDEATGTAVVSAFDATGSPLLLPYILGSQALIALGALVTVIGARLSRTVPTWLLVATIVLLLAFFLAPSAPGSALDVVLSFAQVLLWATLGWFGWRASR